MRARIEWEQDGEEWVSGNALRLDPDVAIFVEFSDKRCKITGAWLSPDDVSWPGKPPPGQAFARSHREDDGEHRSDPCTEKAKGRKGQC